ncbi:MAG: glycosyltransferase, partial [Pseudomonadales bacterium]
MRLLLITDAWYPQVNGVVRALSTVCRYMEDWGHEVVVIGPDRFKNVPAPTYPEIRLALTTPRSIGRFIEQAQPDAVHIATEGPLGLTARWYLMHRGMPFTTSFHTLFPQYLKLR